MKRPKSQSLDRHCVNAIRFLAVDAVEEAKSGHPGMPMGMADCAYILWTRHLRYMPSDPMWPDRDRFVLSAGHGSMLLYALLYLCGFDVSMDDLRQFRQWGSRTPGHPEYGSLPGVETTTGPLGQGFANGVGMALAAKIKAEMFNGGGFQPVSYRIYGIVSDGDLMEGISAEAASLAGHLGLGNLIYIYDNNKITIEGAADLAFSEDVSGRFRACGWQTIEIDGHDHNQIDQALTIAAQKTQRPTLIIASTHIGYGSPGKQDSADSHGAPLGFEEVSLSRQNLQWKEPPFSVPSNVRRHFKEIVSKRSTHYTEWTRAMNEWRKSSPDLSEKWDRFENRSMPAGLIDSFLKVVSEEDLPTRAWSGKILQTASSLLPVLIGGSADLGPSNNSLIKGSASIKKDTFSGKNIHFGIREHAMGGILNGMALSGMIPYGATFLVFSDYMRPAIRLAALMKLRVIYLFTHDSLFLGEDGPTHQPVEHLAALRIIPGLTVFRPADGLETAAAWVEALENRGPTALILTRQKV
ncbi:MAG TPA: transketolase, partial [bacterium]|nr:transketolase [bacterium]